MLHFKHPQRVNSLGSLLWHGIIYGEGAVGLPVADPEIYHGRFGTGLFQIIYRRNDYSLWGYFSLLEWHVAAVLVLSLALIWPGMALVALGMWVLTLVATLRATMQAPLVERAPFWCRPLVFAFHLVQPAIRAAARYKHRLSNKQLPVVETDDPRDVVDAHVKRVGVLQYDLYWTSNKNHGRTDLLHSLVDVAAANKWPGDFHAEWDEDDVDLVGDWWHGIAMRTATEELGWPKRFTRVRCTLRPTILSWMAMGVMLLFTAEASAGFGVPGAIAGATGLSALLCRLLVSRRHCRRALSALVWKAGKVAGLDPVPVRNASLRPDHSAEMAVGISS
jgi:hypothetical protein